MQSNAPRQRSCPARSADSRAFTLLESLVVLATIFVLGILAIPIFKVYVLGEEARPNAPQGDYQGELQKRKTYDIRFTGEEPATPQQETPAPGGPDQ